MHHRFSSLALATALLFGLGVDTAAAKPLHPSRPEILKADLDGRIKLDEMSLVVIQPAKCEGHDVPVMCAQFSAHQPEPGSYVYAADSRIAQRRSIEGQVQALPAALKERRYVMLLDWQYALKNSDRLQMLSLNGEAVVYDQTAKKAVWHGIVLDTSPVEKFGSLAGDYIKTAINQMWSHADMQRSLAERGIGVRNLGARQSAGEDPNLVIFNRRPDLGFWISPESVWLTLASADAPSKKLYFGMPPDSYLALSLPAGKYEIGHGSGAPVVLEAGTKSLVYRLRRGSFLAADSMEEVPADEFEVERIRSRNMLMPDSEAGIHRRTGVLSWADVPVEPGTPVSEELPPKPAAAAVPRPVRSDRPFARVRMVGLTGLSSEIIPNSSCYRKKSALESVGNLLGGAAKTLAKPRGLLGWGLLGPAGALIESSREDKNVRIGMKDTPATRSLDKKGNWLLPAYVHEMEVVAGSPVTVRVAYVYQMGNRNVHCHVAGSFVPEAGADYEATFDMVDEHCYARVKEIDAIEGGEAMAPVAMAPAQECTDPQK